MSKKATVDYLRRHFREEVSLQKIYRYLDKLYNTQQELVQEISVKHTKELFGGNLGILFYDVTTLYFETTDKDELRESGFSKDGKNANSQVVLGLLVSRGGYPLSYSLFNDSQYEGYTMNYFLNHVHEYDSDYSRDLAELLPSSLKDRKIL